MGGPNITSGLDIITRLIIVEYVTWELVKTLSNEAAREADSLQ
jgi:hypothetical protein